MTQWFDEKLRQLDHQRDYAKLRELTKLMEVWCEALATCVWQLTDRPADRDLRTKTKRILESYVCNEDANLIDTELSPVPPPKPESTPQDVHTENAARIFGVAPHQVTPEQRRTALNVLTGKMGVAYLDPTLLRTPEGHINNCGLAFGAPEDECQICRGVCPDRDKF